MDRRLTSLIACLLLLLASGAAMATPELMGELPSSDRFRCLICHVSPDPVQADLNSFGDAFVDNGLKWDAVLAAASSDTDHCTNGFELGDEDGDGELDADQTQERNNPGQNDCNLQLNKKAWSELKRLFR